jgi:hypothetical protein
MYKASASIQCWKRHTCVSCNAIYRYLFVRQKSGHGATAAEAQKDLNKYLQAAIAHEYDARPCPTCGVLQPEMVGAKRAMTHLRMIALAVLLLVVFLNIGGAKAVYSSTVASLILVSVNLLARFINPNANLSANKLQAQQFINNHTLVLDQPGMSKPLPQVSDSKRFSLAVIGGIILHLVGVISFTTPEVVRLACGWKLNAGVKPAVVGLGEICRLDVPSDIHCVSHYWNATVAVTCHNAEELDSSGPKFLARSKQISWDSKIKTKSSLKDGSANLWVEILVPKMDTLAGKQARLTINMDVTYAVSEDRNTFVNRRTQLSHYTTLDIASLGAGQTYTELWWWGMCLGWLLQVAGSGAFYKEAKRVKSSVAPQCYQIQCRQA